ncbi:MAG: helix-turn-helix transcriptional regulator [Clostridia bacterium]|nr:helix-turn-helix transcriptional regulator [Clostridia bacterium]MDE7265036.1 helix-turn-helix transcriptional regulator [Clostridia bacterium]
MKFSTRLKELRTEKNLSQRQLAEAIGVRQPTIARWEAGFFEPSASDVVMLAKFFGVTTDYILGLNDF